MDNSFVLLESALEIAKEVDQTMMNNMKGVGLNLATLQRETLYQLHDGVITELYSREGCAIQVFNEQKVYMDQLNF